MADKLSGRIASRGRWTALLLLGAVWAGIGAAQAQAPTTGADPARCWPVEGPARTAPAASVPAAERRAAPASKSDSPIKPDFPTLQRTCWVELDQVERLIVRPEAVYWVDIRTPRQAKALPLPGALRVATDDIALKPFLRRATVVLVGTGWDDSAVLSACERLARQGLSVRTLKGGARAWQAAGRPVGWAAEGWGPNEIDPTDFIEAAPRERWPVIGLDLPPALAAPVPAARWAKASATSSWSPARLFPAAARQNLPIVVLASEPTSARRATAENKNLIWVRGGVAAYQRALERWRDTVAEASRAPVRPCGGG